MEASHRGAKITAFKARNVTIGMAIKIARVLTNSGGAQHQERALMRYGQITVQTCFTALCGLIIIASV